MSRIGLSALALLAVALTAAGCGGSTSSNGSKQLTRAELIAKADAICKRANAERAAMPSIRTRSDYAIVLPRVATNNDAAIAELARLTPPASMASDWKQIIASERTLTRYMRTFSKNVASYDIRATRALVHQADSVRQSMIATAQGAGFNDCAKFG